MEQSVGDRLAQFRRLLSFVLGRDVAQDELAQMAGFSLGVWSHWEKGHKSPSEATLQSVAELAQRHGMPYINAPWLRYGIGEGFPTLAKPASTQVEIKPFTTQGMKKLTTKQAKRRKGK